MCRVVFSVVLVTFFFLFYLILSHANINSGARRQTYVIVEVGLANAISGEIKWERWGEREISIFYEPFPLLPLGPLWPSAPSRLPPSLIPFSKNVIRKSPFGLSAATLSSCAALAALAYITACSNLPPPLPLLPARQSLGLLSQAVHAISSVRWRKHSSSVLSSPLLWRRGSSWACRPLFPFISPPHSHRVQPPSNKRHQ